MSEPQATSSREAPELPDLTGAMVGRFAIRSRLGAGGMGEVYRADDTRLKRSVALKRIAPRLRTDENYRQRFLREAEHASLLNDQRIAGIYDVLEENNETFLVMEYVEGVTLRDRLTGPYSLRDFLPIAIQCAEALAAAHDKGVVHRDIKPENIMLTPRGQIKILDFGVAKRLPGPEEDPGSGSTASGPGKLTGTPAYMAPEVLLEEPSDERADIFSLGVVCYEMLAGQHPFRTESFLGTTDRILHAEPLPLNAVNPQVPESLVGVISQMLAKNPGDRTATAAALLPDLRALERGERPPLRLGEFLRRRPGRRTVAAVAAVIAAFIALASVPTLRHWAERRIGIAQVPREVHLAVLPFAVTGETPETAAFAKGLVETLTARLSQLTERRSLLVVPASEVWAQKVGTVEEARREFGVNLVLAGSLQQSGEVMRVTYALVDAATRRQLRADTVTAAAGDPFGVEDRVVDSVLGNLEIALLPPEKRAFAERGTQDAAAYEEYLRGRGYLQDYQKPENIESAIQVFQQALRRDPQYARAAAGLGEAYWKKYLIQKEPDLVKAARLACSQAASLDAKLADARVCLGTLNNGTGEYERAVQDFQVALSEDPTRDDAFRGLANAYQRLGKLEDAEKTFQRAVNLRPQYWAEFNSLGMFYFETGQYAGAERMFKKVTELAPENHRGYDNLGVAEYMQDSWAEAEKAYKKSISLRETSETYSNLGALYFFQGRYAEAAQVFEAGVRLSPRNCYVRGNLADAYRWIPGQEKDAEENYRQAIALAEQELKINPRDAEITANLALWQAKTNSRGEAARAIEMALSAAPADTRYMYYAAVVYKLAGDRRKGFKWLKKSVAHGYPVREIRADPEMRDLRDDPAFRAVLAAGQH